MSLIQLAQDVCAVDFYRKPEAEAKPKSPEEAQEASGGLLSYFGLAANKPLALLYVRDELRKRPDCCCDTTSSRNG